MIKPHEMSPAPSLEENHLLIQAAVMKHRGVSFEGGIVNSQQVHSMALEKYCTIVMECKFKHCVTILDCWSTFRVMG